MSPNNTAGRPAYNVEELLALRASASESRVSLEKFPDEEVIKEHVVKRMPTGEHVMTVENVPPPSATNSIPNSALLSNAVPNGPRNGMAFGGFGGFIKRPSPTPSIKRNMAEQLIKQHGSPPHVRVTAGGRIVPNDLPQLGSPRLPYTPPSRFSNPGSARMPYAMPNGAYGASQLPKGFLSYNLVGKLVQFVDGRWIEVRHDGFGQPMYQITPPNMPFPSANSVFGMLQPPPMGMIPYPPSFGDSHSPVLATAAPQDIDEQLSVSRAEYERVRQEKIELERHEVKASDQLSAAQRQQIVGEKRKYVMMLDTIRKKIKELETAKANGSTSAPLSNGNGSSNGGTGVSSLPTPVYNMGGIDGAIGLTIPGQHWPMQHPAMPGAFPVPWNNLQPAHAAPPPAAPKVHFSPEQLEPAIESPASEPSPSSRARPRRSHAVQIVDPNEGDSNIKYDDNIGDVHGHYPPGFRLSTLSASLAGEHNSNLNPASPSYEPGKPYPLTEGSPPHFIVPAPTPIETPNPPPAELAKHWVFSQQQAHSQHHTYTHTQEHGRFLSNGMHGEHMGTGQKHHHNGHATAMEGIVNSHVETNRSSGEENERSSQRPTSHSSVTTTDFFPTNTHEHSFNKYMSRKTSAAARLSMEAHPCTPMRDPHSGVVSPMTDHLHPNAPPVSPATQYGVPPHLLANSPEDLRLSSFLRDTSRVPPHPVEDQVPQHSPVRAETRDEFHGKSRPYLEGYLAGSSGHAPADPKNQEYCAGYIDGLSKMCLGGSAVTRESSTISLKSETIAVSRTPPNTTDNRSLIAELAGTIPSRSENVRLTQSLNFSSPPSGSNHPGNEAPPNGGVSQPSGTSYPADNTNHRVTSGAGYNLPSSGTATISSHLPRSWSEDQAGIASPSSSFRATGPWNVPSHTPKIVHTTDFAAIAQPQAAVISSSHPAHVHTHNKQSSGAASVNRRMVSTSVGSQPSLTGYSGNQPSARVASIPQRSVFGDDKYVVTSTTTTLEKVKTGTTASTQHENQRSYDGAMDDLQEMKTAAAAVSTGDSAQHAKNTSSIGTGYAAAPQKEYGTPRASAKATSASFSTPPASPTKSTTTGASPKKVTSPRHHLNKLKEKVGEYLDRSTSYCGGDTTASTAPSRAESPDPQKMSPEEKKRWREGWRSKLGVAKAKEEGEVRKWRHEGGGSGRE